MSDNIKLDKIKKLLLEKDYDKISIELNKNIYNIKKEIEFFTKYLKNPFEIVLRKCNRCNYVKEIVKGCW